MSSFSDWYSRRSLGYRRLLHFLSVTVLVALSLWYVPTPYYVTAPGAAVDTSRLVAVEGGTAHPHRLHILIVTTQPASLFWYLYARLDHRAELETPKQFLGDIENYEKYLELSRRMMEDSRQTAQAVALQLMGYGRGVRPEGVEITDLTGTSPAKGRLAPGDVIVGAEGKPVTVMADLQAILKATPAGQTVTLTVRRGPETLTVSTPTTEHADPARKGTAALGVYIKDKYSFDIPIKVGIQPGAITGPSAGLMFTLEIIDQLTPGGIAGEQVVAGTGTIGIDGAVGPIGGIRQKVFSAEAAGATVLFVPPANYEEAKKAATRVEVVKVANVRDALQWLKENRK